MQTLTQPPVNYWADDRCAKAFWGQNELPAYRELMADTIDWLDPKPGERWVDLGCGAGRLASALWTKSEGHLGEVVGLDLAALNEAAFAKMRATLQPSPGERLRFQQVDFSVGLPWKQANLFDGAVSGLAIQYAESYSPLQKRWTSVAYDGLLSDVHRCLKPGGRFVFSVNVPDPSWSRVATNALSRVFAVDRKVRYLRKLFRMWKYGAWLKREARKGRFHYLAHEEIACKLQYAGFVNIEHRVSFAKQAYVFRCQK